MVTAPPKSHPAPSQSWTGEHGQSRLTQIPLGPAKDCSPTKHKAQVCQSAGVQSKPTLRQKQSQNRIKVLIISPLNIIRMLQLLKIGLFKKNNQDISKDFSHQLLSPEHS